MAETSFLQDPPRLGNQYDEDSGLRAFLSRVIPQDILNAIQPDLSKFGQRVAAELWPLAKALDEPANHPRLKQLDAWGRKVDEIETHVAWKHMKKVAAEEGIVAIGYERTVKEYSRLYQMTKLYLFGPSSGLFNCPLAMTDGAARLLEIRKAGRNGPNFKDSPSTADPFLEDAYRHLTSRASETFWTSGQWMTERKGGSDVAMGTETVARRVESDPPGMYRLYGYKWFTSATDSDMSITLARIQNAQGSITQGTEGLACFYLPVRVPSEKPGEEKVLNGIKIHRLKNKLGTRQLPTAELELCGTKAYLISTPGRGVATITNMVNVTRIYNAISSVGYMRRMLAALRDYSHRRFVFGSLLSENPLHLEVLAALEIQTRGCLYLALECARLMGRVEVLAGRESEEDELLLRLLTPLAKLFTAKIGMSVVSEGLEGFGGQGYIEDTGLPCLFRDAQVLPIWEGTTNVLSFDFLRVMQKSPQALRVFAKVVQTRCKAAASSNNSDLKSVSAALVEALGAVNQFMTKTRDLPTLQARARDVALSLSKIFTGSILLEHALWSGQSADVFIATEWALGSIQGLGPLLASSLSKGASQPPASSFSSDPKARGQAVRAVALDICPDSGKARGFGDRDISGRIRARL